MGWFFKQDTLKLERLLQSKKFYKINDTRSETAFFFSVYFQNRELQMMRLFDHCNVVKLKHCFYSNGDKVRLSLKQLLFFSTHLLAPG